MSERQLRILHCLRAPVGGLFRHVGDLANAQIKRGHAVGVICDASTGNSMTDDQLAALEGRLSLGVRRVPMARQISLRDLSAYSRICKYAAELDADVLHGHGAKGGALARLVAWRLLRSGRKVAAFYTPHGGSLHYNRSQLQGRVFLDLERHLAQLGDGLIFESAFSRAVFADKVGAVSCPVRVIPNGLRPDEFSRVTPDRDAADFVFVGELRHLKGVDVLIAALARLNATRPVSTVIVGEGDDQDTYRRMVGEYGLDGCVRFTGALPARRAFAMGRCLVMPSRAESFPYIVLEAGAAGLPQVLSDVGGIPEIIAAVDAPLVQAGDVEALAARMTAFLETPAAFIAGADRVRERIAARFTVDGMTDAVLDFYQHAARRAEWAHGREDVGAAADLPLHD